jgi:very-short-patch-repair endonuclease
MRDKIIRARMLRKHATPAERQAWTMLRDHRCLGYHFRRQHVLHGFICDFYCARLRLVIEVDGGYHDTRQAREYDAGRSDVLRQFDIQTYRIRNEEVSRERLQAIIRSAKERSPSPRSGEGDRG